MGAECAVMAKPLRSEYEEGYARVWNAVRGGIRDFRNAHPDEIMPTGSREASLIKRIVGQLESMAERWSEPSTPADNADGASPLSQQSGALPTSEGEAHVNVSPAPEAK